MKLAKHFINKAKDFKPIRNQNYNSKVKFLVSNVQLLENEKAQSPSLSYKLVEVQVWLLLIRGFRDFNVRKTFSSE